MDTHSTRQYFQRVASYLPFKLPLIINATCFNFNNLFCASLFFKQCLFHFHPKSSEISPLMFLSPLNVFWWPNILYKFSYLQRFIYKVYHWWTWKIAVSRSTNRFIYAQAIKCWSPSVNSWYYQPYKVGQAYYLLFPTGPETDEVNSMWL